VSATLDQRLGAELERLREAGTYKRFNTLRSPQGPLVQMEGRGEVLVLSSNNYLGLADRPEVVEAGIEGLRRYGAGTASVRFICGTFEPHLELERELAELVGTEAALTYVSCWNANEAAIPSLTDDSTVILSDELNHASIIDAVRLAKPARKAVFKHSDMDDLRAQLESLEDGQRALVLSDGVFSMEGDLAKLPELVELTHAHGGTLVVDDSHGTGVVGETGRGVAEHYGLLGEVDVITSTLGKALGGAAGGFVAGANALTDYLTQRSRPQLFSNALPPTVAMSSLAAVRYLEQHPERVEKLRDNTKYFREQITEAGFKPLPGETPIIPIIVGETAAAIQMSNMMLDEGVFVTGFGFPVVPHGQARVRCQISAAHSRDDLDEAVRAFKRVGAKLGIVR
jgi:glycine C-acetyltransferase